MKLTKEQISEIQDALQTRVPTPGNCPICKNENATWELGTGLVYFTIQDDPQNFKIAGRSLPCIPATCSNCGNVQFFNILKFGQGKILNQLQKPVKKQEKPEIAGKDSA